MSTMRAARRILAGATASSAAILMLAPQAGASVTPSPAWTITSVSEPTNFAPGSGTPNQCVGSSQPPPCYVIVATNSGGAATDPSKPITITDALPAGVTLGAAGAIGEDDTFENPFNHNTVSCQPGPPITCTDAQDVAPLLPGQVLVMDIPVNVSSTAPATVSNSVEVTGGGTAMACQTPPPRPQDCSSWRGSDPTTVSAVPASYAIQSFDGAASNSDGSPTTQAGSHPYQATTSFKLTTTLNSRGQVIPAGGGVRDINVGLPPGLVGDPSAVPQCSRADMQAVRPSCPVDSQVGVATLFVAGFVLPQHYVVYNVVPPPGEPAQFAIRISFTTVWIDTSVRTGGDYGITASLHNLPQPIAVTGSSLTFWGVPGDPLHDSERCGNDPFNAGGGACNPGGSFQDLVKPFMTLPTSCLGPQTTTMETDSWETQGSFTSASFLSHDNLGNPIGASGCDALDFSPTISIQPDTTTADSPAGLSVDLHIPQNDNPTGLAEATLKDTSVTLPAGMSVSPSAADGLGACSPDQIGLDNANQPTCPDASKVGSVEVDTPLLRAPLFGSVFVAQQNNNPFGSLLALYLVAQGDGVLVKLAGHVVPDPITGQLTTTFDNNPQLPFSDFKLDFFGGPRGALATPDSCGTFTTTTSLSPWSGGAPATPSDLFTISAGCVSGFAPSFTAGTQNTQAGSFSPFVLSFSRGDTDQELSGLTVTLPPGMLAKLAGVEECSDTDLAAAAGVSGTAELANPSCPSGSQVGTVTTGAGPGPDPFFIGGKAYLTGPYKGAPYGLAVIVPAVAGPYDLGTVVVRQALHVDPTTAQVTAVSDPFPTILQGIPLRIRRVDVTLNRPDFTLNPTSCDPMSITGTLTSTGGLSAPLSSRFQVGGCQKLPFSPTLRMKLSGKGKTHSGQHPTLTATLAQGPGQTNIRSAKVALPLSLALDPNNSQHVCDYDTAQAVHGGAVGCPASTIIGTAAALTPLLSQPLTGNVYLVQGIRFNKQGQRIRTLPSLLIPLRGQIAIDLRAQSAVNGAKQLVTTFSTIPDAPVSTFALTITGGPKGLLVITGRGRSICGKAQVANADFGAQSGKTEAQDVTMATPCGKPASLFRSRVVGHTVRVTVHLPGPGKLVATGQGLRRRTWHSLRAQTVTLTIRLTRGAAARASRTGRLATHVTLTWTPTGGATFKMVTRTLTIRR